MTGLIDDDEYLKIHLLSYDRPTADMERFYFLEMSTIQATTLIKRDTKITSQNISAWTDDQKYFSDEDRRFNNIGEFNDFFIEHADMCIHNCDLKLTNGLQVSSHDDGEVSLSYPADNGLHSVIDDIFSKYRLDKAIIQTLKKSPGHYFAIDSNSNIKADFVNFDHYVERGR